MKPTAPSPDAGDSRPNLVDWRGLGDLVTLTTDRIATPVEGVHRAIVGRWFRMGGPKVEPAGRVVDGLTASIYQTVRLGGAVVGSAISMGADIAGRRSALRPVWSGRTGRHVQSILNGVWGDKFDDDESPFRIDLGLRDLDGAPLPVEPVSLHRAFPEATSRLVVMLHGFGDTEGCWASDDDDSLVAALESDGFSVLLIRYNSGRSVSDNGSDLANLLESVRGAWPVAVEEIALVGHSMGGLVARSAESFARSAAHEWLGMATHLVTIGAPHLGSPIEKGVQLASDGLGWFEESRPIQGFLEQRSAGIKDLRFGVVGDHGNGDIAHHFIAGTVTKESTHPVGRLFGDLVVRVASATGKGRQRQVEASDVMVVGGRNHAGLIHDTAVKSQTRKWLAARR